MSLEKDNFEFEADLDVEAILGFESVEAPNQGVDGTCLDTMNGLLRLM